ncbi:hypothetical protein ACWCSD_17810 [Nonomuraea sp. NPDC001684]
MTPIHRQPGQQVAARMTAERGQIGPAGQDGTQTGPARPEH